MNQVISALLFIWAGLLLGVSFIATPAKFLAPSLPMAQALDVGRWTFHVLGLIEWGFVAVVGLLILVAWMRLGQGSGLVLVLLAGIVAILALETFWLRPALDARALQIMAGQSAAPNLLHTLYIVFEIVKLLLILAAAVVGARRHPAIA
jgi:hypothetical protein